MSGVFISYRRADAQGWAGRLGEELRRAFGGDARYFDLASTTPGADYLSEIDHAIVSADVVLVLIGPRWLDLRDDHNVRRLDDANDVVAAEVSLALTHQALVIPVLLGGATMPAAAALPEKLQSLARRNALELSDSRWEYDRDRLLAVMEASTLLKRHPAPSVPSAVSVGDGIKIENSDVGRVTGVRGPVSAVGVSVLKDAVLTNTRTGDITGIDVTPPPAPGSTK